MAAPLVPLKKQISNLYNNLQIIFDSDGIHPRSPYHTPLRAFYAVIENLNDRPSEGIAYLDAAEELSTTLYECAGLVTLLEIRVRARTLSSNYEDIVQKARDCTRNLKRLCVPNSTSSANPRNSDFTAETPGVVEQLLVETERLNAECQRQKQVSERKSTEIQRLKAKLNEVLEEKFADKNENATLKNTNANQEMMIADQNETIADLKEQELVMHNNLADLYNIIGELPWDQNTRDPTRLHHQHLFIKFKLESIGDTLNGIPTKEASSSEGSSSGTTHPPPAPDPPSAKRAARPSSSRKTKETKKGKEPANKFSDSRQTPYESHRSPSPASTITSQTSKINTGKTRQTGWSSGLKQSRSRR